MNAERVTGKEATLPILGNILIRAEKNFLNIIATNLETGIIWRILCKTEAEGGVVLPAMTFSSFIGSLPNKSVSINVDGFSVTVASEGRKSVFKGMGVEEFPALPVNTEGEFVAVGCRVFCQALAQVVNFTSMSTVKPEIAGVYLLFTKNEVKIVATDSFRLGERVVAFSKKQQLLKDYPLILPLRAVKELVAIFGERDGDMKIYFTPNQITVQSYMDEVDEFQSQYVARLIEGEFPDYQAIIPAEYVTRIVFSKKELMNHIKSASLFSGKACEVNLQVKEKGSLLKTSSQSAELGEYESEMNLIEFKGRDLAVSFNYKFLMDGLSVLKGDNCAFEFSSDDGPGVLKSADETNFMYILMPIKKD